MQSLETRLDPVSHSFLWDQKHMFIVSYSMVYCFLETQIHFFGPHACAAALNIIKPLASSLPGYMHCLTSHVGSISIALPKNQRRSNYIAMIVDDRGMVMSCQNGGKPKNQPSEGLPSLLVTTILVLNTNYWVFHTYQPIMNGISSLIELLDP